MSNIILATLPQKVTQKQVDFIKAQAYGMSTEVRLRQIPPLSNQSAFYQICTGIGPEWTGMYDNLRVSDYHVVETTPDQETVKMLLCNLIQTMGKTTSHTTKLLPNNLTDLVCLELEHFEDIETLFQTQKEHIIKAIILPESTYQHPKQVNINNFLVHEELMECRNDGQILWEETLAYYVGYGQLWINLIGRETKGVVTPGQEYEQVRDALITLLQEKFIDPETGSKIIENIWKKEDLYDNKGKHFTLAPDLALAFSTGYIPSVKSTKLDFNNKDISNSSGINYETRKFQVLVWGDEIKRGHSTIGHTLDLVPTVLYLLDLPLPRELKGKVMQDIVAPDFWSRHPVCFQTESGLTPTEEALIIDRLETLGYID